MTNTPDIEPKLRMLDLLGDAVRLSWQEREPLALLAGLYALLTLLLIWPFRSPLAELSQLGLAGILKGAPPHLEAELDGFLMVSIASHLVWCATLVIWARLIFMGRSEALADGIKGVLGRTLGIFLRSMEFIGILAAIVILGSLVLGYSLTGIAIIVGIALASAMLLAGVFGVAAFETACDRGRWLALVWRDLKGKRGVLALSLLVLFLPSILLEAVKAPAIDTATGTAYILFSYWIWSVTSCIWITYSGLVAEELISSQKDA